MGGRRRHARRLVASVSAIVVLGIGGAFVDEPAGAAPKPREPYDLGPAASVRTSPAARAAAAGVAPASVTASAGTVVYRAAFGVANAIAVYAGYTRNNGVIVDGPWLFIADTAGNTITPQGGCRQALMPDGTGRLDPTRIKCPYDAALVEIYLEDKNDTGFTSYQQLCNGCYPPMPVDFYGDDGNDTLRSAQNSSYMIGGRGDDTIEGLEGDDVIRGGGEWDHLFGGSGNDTIDGDDGDDEIKGGTGNDVLNGGAHLDNVEGGAGNDQMSGGAHADVMDGNEGDDTITGDDGNDSIAGGPGFDTQRGGLGDDRLGGSLDPDTLDCGDGAGDWVSYQFSYAAVTVALGVSASGGDASGDVIQTSCEGITGSEHADTLTGNDGTNRLRGLGNADIIWGRGGNDTLIGDAGDDRLVGELGADTIDCGDGGADVASYASSPGGVTATIEGWGSGAHAQGDYVGGNCERLKGSIFGDLLTGNGGANTLFGEGGDDRLEGRGGGDTLDCGIGKDRAVYTNSPGRVNVTLSGSGAWSDAQGDALSPSCEGFEGSAYGDTVNGDAGANLIFGNGGGDTINGNGGDDVILGMGDGDSLHGGPGNDAIGGGPGADEHNCGDGTDDYVSYFDSPSAVNAIIGGAGRDGDAEGDWIWNNCEGLDGSGRDDVLTGDAGNNRLRGRDGNDTIRSAGDSFNGSHDTVECGAGADTVDLDKDTLAGDCEQTTGDSTIPVLLVHGYDWTGEVGSPGGPCSAQWNTLRGALELYGWTAGQVKTVGYYQNDVCDLMIHNYNPDGAPITNNTPIETLARGLARKISDTYGNRPVNLVGFSMGGLIIRRMLMDYQKGASGYPSSLNIVNLVTVQSPLAGSVWANAVPDALCKRQCQQMRIGSSFLNEFSTNDPGPGSTDITEIASAADNIVLPTSSQMAYRAQHKFVYGTPPGYGHIEGPSYNDVSSAFDLPVLYSDTLAGSTYGWDRAPHGSRLIYFALKRTDW